MIHEMKLQVRHRCTDKRPWIGSATVETGGASVVDITLKWSGSYCPTCGEKFPTAATVAIGATEE